MSKLGMDLSKFKKISQNKESSTLRHISDGHEIKLSHKFIHPKALEELKSLPIHKFAEGGMASDDFSDVQSDQPLPEYQEKPPVNPIVDTVNSYLNEHPDIKNIVGPDEEKEPSVEPEKLEEKPKEGLEEKTTEEKPDDDNITPTKENVSLLQQSLQNQISGAAQVAKAQIDLSQETQKIEAQRLKEQVSAKEEYLKNISPIQAESDAAQAWINAHPENSKRYVDNMSTGGKIRTAIGLLLGGIGSGLSHGPNLAAKYLDDQIERDIKDQQAQIANKKGLLAYNLQKMGNIRDAYNMTRIQTNDMVASQLREAASRAQSQSAAGSLLQLAGSYQQKNAILMGKMSQGVNKKDQDMIKEIDYRKNIIKSNVDKLITMIKSEGTYNVTGAHNKNLDRTAEEIATDMAKLTDPSSVARPGEVEMWKKNLVESGVFQFDKTAIDALKDFRNGVDKRADIAYIVRGLKPPTKTTQENKYEGKTGTLNGVRVINKNGKWVPIGK